MCKRCEARPNEANEHTLQRRRRKKSARIKQCKTFCEALLLRSYNIVTNRLLCSVYRVAAEITVCCSKQFHWQCGMWQPLSGLARYRTRVIYAIHLRMFLSRLKFVLHAISFWVLLALPKCWSVTHQIVWLRKKCLSLNVIWIQIFMRKSVPCGLLPITYDTRQTLWPT